MEKYYKEFSLENLFYFTKENNKRQKENWAVIEQSYSVSNLGRVISLNYNNTGKPKVLSQGVLTKGYLGVSL